MGDGQAQEATTSLEQAEPARSDAAIGICGSYGGLNLGDEAILTVAIEQLRQAVPGAQITVFTRDVDHTSAHYDVERVVDAREESRDVLAPELERLDVLLLGGGGILYDREAETYLHLPRIAQALDVPTATYAIGAGPLERQEDRRAVADVLNGMASITVRDHSARRLLEEVGVEKEIAVTGDPALLLEAEPASSEAFEAQGIPTDRHLIGMSVREPGSAVAGLEQDVYHTLMANTADFVADRFDANLVFIPMEDQDVRHAHRVIGLMGIPDRAFVLRGRHGPRRLLGLMGELDLAVGMRLHFLIFAALVGVPLLALPYASKVTSFLERLDLPTPKIVQREHAGLLLSAMDRVWDERHEWSQALRERVPEVQEEARGSATVVAELLQTEVRDASAGAT